MHDFATIVSDIKVPPHDGPIDETMHPHEGKDPANAPENKWAAFPEPEPEVIPKSYPNLPPFSECLDHPIPDIDRKRAVQSMSKKKKDKPSKPEAETPSSPKKSAKGKLSKGSGDSPKKKSSKERRKKAAGSGDKSEPQNKK